MFEKINPALYIVFGVLIVLCCNIYVRYKDRKYVIYYGIIEAILKIELVCLYIFEIYAFHGSKGFFISVGIIYPVYIYSRTGYIIALILPWLILSVLLWKIITKRFARDISAILISTIIPLIILYVLVSLKLNLIHSIILGLFTTFIISYRQKKEDDENNLRLYACLKNFE